MLDLTPLRVFLRTTQRAGDDRELSRARITLDISLGHISERADHDVPAILRLEFRRHGLEATSEEKIQEHRLDDVVAMVTECDLGHAILGRPAIERPATQARAQSAHRLAFGYYPLDYRIGVLLDDVKRHTESLQILRQHLFRKTRLLLVKIDGNELEAHWRTALQRKQDIKQRVGILATRETDHDFVALGDHGVILDRLADEAAQLRLQLAKSARCFCRRQRRNRHRRDLHLHQIDCAPITIKQMQLPKPTSHTSDRKVARSAR